ncbi:DUF2867 domain-containing protein [Nakamurella sp. YIM 132087]|uniref:DUF2867 domain-containing protein n=1 Tax=Nakamurella alba TaxID=2665158 RepID=A0A7K1FUE1_9ACTN|nr:DUF2867 domain-containing protein [Nakamurella alba]MTD16813.1 DUF2867 domain-containing protein [Nakamurella alba]
MDTLATPALRSAALDAIPAPDFADVAIRVLPEGAPADPELWARTVFGRPGVPVWVGAALALRQLVVPLIGVNRAPRNVFDVERVVGEEALILARDTHLDFACAIGVDTEQRLVRVTTAVRLHGMRGRIYFAPVRLAHPIVVQSMLAKAARHLAGTVDPAVTG